MKELENLVIENKKRDFDPCSLEVVHFGENILLSDVVSGSIPKENEES